MIATPWKAGGAIAWMARNPIAANLLMVVLLAGGAVSTGSITKELLPDTTDEAVSITVTYPGASSEEIEQGVILALEEAIRGLPGTGEVWSLSFPGRAIFRARLVPGGDLQQLARDVQNQVSAIRSFPEQMEPPQVSIDPRRRNVLSLVIYGDADRRVLKDAAEAARDLLTRTGQITQMELIGIPRPQVNIDISEAALRDVGMSIDEVAQVVRSGSVDLAAGGIKASTGELLVRVQERRHWAREFADIVLLTTDDGGVLRLGDVAEIEDGFEDTDQYATFDGKNAVRLDIYRIGEETPTGIAEAVEASLPDIQAALSGGLELRVLNDDADAFTQRVTLLLENGSLGLLLVLISLGLLLNARLAFWVMMGIPISFMGAMLLIPHFGVTINMMSLFAFILALGIVVDDAIVVGENVYAHREQGEGWMQAAVEGTREVAKPVVFSILSNIIAFVPLLVMPGPRGKLFWMIPAVVIAAFLVSLFEALFILPAHLGHAPPARGRFLAAVERGRQAVFQRLQRFIHEVYAPTLERVMRQARLVPFVGVALVLVATAYIQSGRLGYQSFPRVESDYAFASLVLPYGTPVARTTEVVDRITAGATAIADRPENAGLVLGIFADVGHDGSHTAELRVFLAPPDVREPIMSTDQFVKAWREAVGEVQGVEALRFLADEGGPGGGHAMSLELSHRDREVLEEAADYLTARMAEYPIVSQAINDFQAGQPQYDVRLNDAGRALGLDATSLARQLRGRFYGIESTRQLRARDEVTILVRGTAEERSHRQALERALVKTAPGTFVPLSEVATVERSRAYTKIERRNGNRVVDVDADITPRSRTPEMIDEVDAVIMPDLKKRFPGIAKNLSGRQRMDAESMASLNYTFPLAMLFIFALLAVPFGSYTLAGLILLMTIPFGFVGATLGHVLMDYSLTIPGLLGFIALAGVLVNDALILVDFAERRRQLGDDPWTAIHSAALQRFRPIFLTTLTTGAGLAPMIFETSRQARFLIPMAISLVFGLLFATAAILLMLPSVYVLLGRRGWLPPAER